MSAADDGPAPPAAPAPVSPRRRVAAVGDAPVALFLPCAAGVEPLLADEVQRILGAGTAVPWHSAW